jgi:hypothetical protein
MSEITLNFERWLDDAVVEAVIEFDYEDDFDFVPYGEGSVRREYRTINIPATVKSTLPQKKKRNSGKRISRTPLTTPSAKGPHEPSSNLDR